MVKITINDNVTKLKEKSKSKNTQDKYEGDWLKFIEYCKSKYKCNPLEVDDLDFSENEEDLGIIIEKIDAEINGLF